MVRMIFQWASEGAAQHQIACRLNQGKISTKKGCQWHPLTVGQVLRNRAYTGVQFYGENRYRKVKGGKREVTRRPESEVIRIEGFTPRIISPELFELVQERLASPQAKKTRSENQYLMTGFVRCLVCGSPVVGACLNKVTGTTGAGPPCPRRGGRGLATPDTYRPTVSRDLSGRGFPRFCWIQRSWLRSFGGTSRQGMGIPAGRCRNCAGRSGT